MRGKTEIHFRATDGVRLAGYRAGRGKTGIVLAHQSRGDLCQWVNLAYFGRLAKRYLVIAFDMRNHGDSAIVREFPKSQRFERDVAGAVKLARSLGATKVFAAGASLGGTASLAAAPLIRPALAGVVSVSGPAQYGTLDALAAVKRLRVPALFIVGSRDQGFVADARTLYRAAATKEKALAVLPSPFHGVELVDGEGAASTRLDSFFALH
jgi:pimeloyl-ACP methyl ester carboxylesterase